MRLFIISIVLSLVMSVPVMGQSYHVIEGGVACLKPWDFKTFVVSVEPENIDQTHDLAEKLGCLIFPEKTEVTFMGVYKVGENSLTFVKIVPKGMSVVLYTTMNFVEGLSK